MRNDTPEWLRLLRGWPAHHFGRLCRWAGTPLWVWWWSLPYAGDWEFRAARREWRRENTP